MRSGLEWLQAIEPGLRDLCRQHGLRFKDRRTAIAQLDEMGALWCGALEDYDALRGEPLSARYADQCFVFATNFEITFD